MLRRVISATAAIALLAAAPAVTAAAARHEAHHAKSSLATVKSLGGTGPWNAYVDDAPGGKICYLIGKPKKIDGADLKADEVRMSVTHRPADKVKDVVNFMLGFRAGKGSSATLNIDGHKYDLFTERDGAWTRDAATDHAVVVAMTRGRKATIKAKQEHGDAASERYDLNGFTSALALIDKACGVRQ
jgi:Invasion associated locus B (IalB) protein